MDHVLHYKDWKNSYIPNILKEVYLDAIYTQYVSYMKNQVVIDAGMNIGLWSLFAAKYAAQVYGFEPAKETYQLAVKNITDNGIKNVYPQQKAVSEKEGTLTFYHNVNSTMNSLNEAVNNKPEAKETVKAIRLDHFLESEGIEHVGFMKFDCEGTEHLFFNSESFRNLAPKLDAFVYEYHSWCGVPPQNINEAISDAGFSTIKQLPTDALVFGCSK